MCALPHNEWNWKRFSNTKACEGWQTYYTREPHRRHSQLKHSCNKQLSEVQPSLKSPFHILFIYTRWLWLYSLCPSGRNQWKPEAFCVPTTPELLKKHQKLFATSPFYQYTTVFCEKNCGFCKFELTLWSDLHRDTMERNNYNKQNLLHC